MNDTDKKFVKNRQNLQPSFSIYHPSQNGNGTAMAVRISPARINSSGYVQIEIASQLTIGDIGRKVFPTFNWKERSIVRLSPLEVAEIIRCMRGDTDSIRNGAGFSHKTDGHESSIRFAHMKEPAECYRIVVKSDSVGGTEKNLAMSISLDEATALELALASSMGRLCFGD